MYHKHNISSMFRTREIQVRKQVSHLGHRKQRCFRTSVHLNISEGTYTEAKVLACDLHTMTKLIIICKHSIIISLLNK